MDNRNVTCARRTLNDNLPTQPDASIELAWNELPRTLGLTPGRGAKVLARLVDFHLVEQIPADDWFAVRSAAPTLKPAQLERLAEHCPQLASAHDTFAAATAAQPFTLKSEIGKARQITGGPSRVRALKQSPTTKRPRPVETGPDRPGAPRPSPL